jgi:hypothetical protein
MITNVEIHNEGFKFNLDNGEVYSGWFSTAQNCCEHWYIRNDPVDNLVGKYIAGIEISKECDSGPYRDQGDAGLVLTILLSNTPHESIRAYPKPDYEGIEELAKASYKNSRFSSLDGLIRYMKHKEEYSHYCEIYLNPLDGSNAIKPKSNTIDPKYKRSLSRRAHKAKLKTLRVDSPSTWKFTIGNLHNGYYSHPYRFVFGDSKIHMIQGSL